VAGLPDDEGAMFWLDHYRSPGCLLV
jgi:hypothetical protein